MLHCDADGALRVQEPEAVKAALKGMKFDAVYDLNGALLALMCRAQGLPACACSSAI